MAALVQSYPQQSSTITMLQTRPSSASGILQSSSQVPAHHPYAPTQVHRNSFHGMNSGMAPTYRGHASMEPIAPYAFTRTPALVSGQRTASGPHLRPDQRAASALGVPTYDSGAVANRSRYPATASISTTSSSSSSDLSSQSQKSNSKDDSPTAVRTVNGTSQSTLAISTSTGLSPPAPSVTVKTSPDRYRRTNNRRAESFSVGQKPNSLASTMPNVKQFYGSSTQQATLALSAKQGSGLQVSQPSKPALGNTPTPGVAADDSQLNRAVGLDQATKYRRRSIHTIEPAGYLEDGASPFVGLQQQGSRQLSSANGRIDQQQHPLRISPVATTRPGTSHGRNASSESAGSSKSSHRSRPSSAKREANPSSMAAANPAPSASSPSASTFANQTSPRSDVPKLVNIPLRGSSSDATKKITNPSPLSKPMAMTPESLASKESFASAVTAALQTSSKPTYAQAATGANSSSPAAKQLAALSDKDGKKNKTSRLRRAFSFGSAAELRKASAENSAANYAAAAAENSILRKGQSPDDELDAEQARIARQQEAGGIGSGIYSGQGNFFTGSTDNISISSTASSASIMIRKMGKGMKKSTRSLVGLFRPKSIIGAPAADAPAPEVSQAQVSMVTVEAEREKTNVNANPHDQIGGGTGYPKLERNSVDAAHTGSFTSERLGSSGTEDSGARRSIVGGEKERAEVLASIKKGILKRSGTDSGNSSPVMRPVLDTKSPSFQLPHIPNVSDSPASSAPSTPNDEQHGHRRTGSVTLGGEDYFMSALRFQGNSQSVPSTPPGTKRNATFSPRIQFHDTWPSGEYDRRGEIATCNRLTPMLAQQIKEELNTFKMEMEVHENSKIYTHFF